MNPRESVYNGESDTKNLKEVSLVLEEINRQAEEANPEERAAIVAKAEAFEKQLDVLENEMGISSEEADEILLRINKGEYDMEALMAKYVETFGEPADKRTMLKNIADSAKKPFALLLLFAAISLGMADKADAGNVPGKVTMGKGGVYNNNLGDAPVQMNKATQERIGKGAIMVAESFLGTANRDAGLVLIDTHNGNDLKPENRAILDNIMKKAGNPKNESLSNYISRSGVVLSLDAMNKFMADIEAQVGNRDLAMN